jgi:hypothetical protein
MQISAVRQERFIVYAIGFALLSLAVTAVWWDTFLPMQDYPQHLFMAHVAATYDTPGLNWQDYYDIRGQFGPYRATFIAQSMLGTVIGVQAAGKVLVTFYLGLIGLLAWILCRQQRNSGAGWGALLCFPLCFNAMYFYGFLNFTMSLPLLVLVLLHLHRLLTGPRSAGSLLLHGLLVLALFLLHPFTLQVFMVLAAAMTLLVGRDRKTLLLGMGVSALALILFLAWSAYDSVVAADGRALTLESLNLRWWPLKWNLSFLGMMFTGMRITSNPVLWVSGLWGAVLVLLLFGLLRSWRQYTVSPVYAVLFGLVVAGFFVLPFSLVLDNRYTFFNVRMAPLALFVLLPFVAAIPLGRAMGGVLAILCIALSLQSAQMHHKIANELESYVPIFDKVPSNARLLPVLGITPSEYLDSFFYARFYSHFPFYYHVLKGGGINPDMFRARLMPVAYKAGVVPTRPPHNDLGRWAEYADQYDYILVRNTPPQVISQLQQSGAELVGFAKGWGIVKLPSPPPEG